MSRTFAVAALTSHDLDHTVGVVGHPARLYQRVALPELRPHHIQDIIKHFVNFLLAISMHVHILRMRIRHLLDKFDACHLTQFPDGGLIATIYETAHTMTAVRVPCDAPHW